MIQPTLAELFDQLLNRTLSDSALSERFVSRTLIWHGGQAQESSVLSVF